MSFNSSPPEDFSELFRRRNLTSIPRDQKELLEKPDSWAVDVKNRAHGLAHVPGHVLQTVKGAYALAQKAASEKPTPKSRKRSASAVTSTNSKRMKNGITDTPAHDDTPVRSSPEREIPWEPSPTRPSPSRPTEVTIDTTIQSSPERAISWESSPAPPGPSLLTKVTVDTTVQSSIVHETPKAAPLGPPPRRVPSPSEDESDNELETEIPQGLPNARAAVNRTAARREPPVPFPMLIASKPMATPPCAQPTNPSQRVIPNTVVAPRETCQGHPITEKRQSRRRFKGITVEDTEKKVHHMPNRLPATKTFATVDSSIPTSSDSVIPATLKATATQEFVIQSIEENESDQDVDESVRSDDEQPAVAERPNKKGESIVESIEAPQLNQRAKTPNKRSSQRPVAVQQSDAQTQVETSPAHLGSRRGSQTKICPPVCIGPSASREPYEVFLHHYPMYAEDDWGRKEAGTKASFISACVYLSWLRQRKLLRDYLYDDFIRAWTEDYKEYVDSAKPRQKTLVAIDWFNKLSEKPTYSQYVVNRGNLSFILKSYPEEVAKANGSLVDGDGMHIYTSSENESDSDNDEVVSSPSAPSDRVSQHRRSRGGVGSNQPAPLSMDGAMDIDQPATPAISKPRPSRQPSSKVVNKVSEKQRLKPKPMPALAPPSSTSRPRKTLAKAPPPFSSRRRETPTQAPPPVSSRPREILTQAPAPPSPQIPRTSMAPPSSVASSTTTTRSRAPRMSQYFDRLSSSRLSATPGGRSAEERARLREHFLKKGSMNGRAAPSSRSSSRFG